jgi:hypothetical protein
MARRKSHFISPIDPRIHFLLFLAMTLILIIFVAVVLQNTSSRARAYLVCGNSYKVVEQAAGCKPYGYKLTKDQNGCVVAECDMTQTSPTTR